jgi:uncharacterized protein (TIGR03437 family)
MKPSIVVLMGLLASVAFAQTLPKCANNLTAATSGDYNAYVAMAPNSIITLVNTVIAPSGNTITGPPIATGTFVASDAVPNTLPSSLGGVSGTVTDAFGTTIPLPLMAVTPGQVNTILPSGIQGSVANINLITSAGVTLCGSIQLNTVSVSLYTADQSGGWLPAAQVAIVHADGTQTFMPAVAQYSSTLQWNGTTWSHYIPIPINLGLSTDTAVLELFGTGIRGANSYIGLSGPYIGDGWTDINGILLVNDKWGDQWQVLYGGPQNSFYGLDQINVVMPHYLAGSGMVTFSVGYPAPLGMGTVGPPCTTCEWQELSSNAVQIYIQ